MRCRGRTLPAAAKKIGLSQQPKLKPLGEKRLASAFGRGAHQGAYISPRTSIFQYDAIAACSFWSGARKAPLIVEFRPWQIVFGIPATATAAGQGPSNERPRLQGLIWGVNMNRNGNQASYRRSYSPNARPTATFPRPAHLTLVNGSTPQSLNVSSNVF